ncbi:uncharacterized protein LOC134217104 [Armigeres subalbatus]|uniref:uncharacterized protein LOC134217104 n=1 Tax=Armigeres subalbatus TaxID=124917 RepID=UPI002ED587CE
MNTTCSHCLLCERSDKADNLVQCDQCDGYVHYSCAGVDDSIADPERSFTCKRCVERDDILSVSSHHTSHRSQSLSQTSRSSALAALRLQQLEKEKQNRLKELDDAEKFQRLRRQVEIEFERQQLAILEEQLVEEENRSIRSRVSATQARDNTRKWVDASGRTDGANNSVATTSAHIVPTTSTSSQQHPTTASEEYIEAATVTSECDVATPFEPLRKPDYTSGDCNRGWDHSCSRNPTDLPAC